MTAKNNELIPVMADLESGMEFVRFEDDTEFLIEKSSLYEKRELNVKVAEFLLLRGKKKGNKQRAIWVVEAKKNVSLDRFSGAAHELPTYDIAKEFVSLINEKLFNAVALTLIGISGRCSDQQYQEIPDKFRSIKWENIKFCFLLVVRDCPDALLPSYSRALSNASYASQNELPHRAVKSMLGLKKQKIYVLNERLARQYKFIR